jgi:glutamyl-tRNA synthetase
MVNFLALLGWSPGGDQEIFTRDELVERFTLEGISGGNAVFNPEKLDWFNQQHIMRLPESELAARVAPLLREAGLWSDDLAGARRQWFERVLALLKPRAKKLHQLVDDARPFLEVSPERDAAAAAKHLEKAELRAPFAALVEAFDALAAFTPAELEQALRATADAHGIKAATLIHATRVAVTGRAASPGLFEVLELLGRDRTLARLRDALPLIPE